MDWSGAGNGTGTRVSGQAELGHGTAVKVAALRQDAAAAHGKGGLGEERME